MRSRTDVTTYALLLVLIVYAALGTLFAVTTPPWQNPDEPAHYNYVAYVATERRLPALRLGDYDEAYLQRLKAEKFPPDLAVDGIRYEFHQPPLYYILATPVYWLSGSQTLLALRLFGVALGACVVLLIFNCARTVAPDRPQIALGAAAFAAFLPMHTALMASVNNDALAELVIAGTMLALLRWQRTVESGRAGNLLVVGALIGLGFLTKATTYILLPVALLVGFARTAKAWTSPQGSGRGANAHCGQERASGSAFPGSYLGQMRRYTLLVAPALLLGLPWWIRNSLLYGDLDILGLAWHDVVVAGQPTAAAWIAEYGWGAYWERAWTFTFKSFWGVFGWMGVFMDGRIYTALYVVSAMAAVGLVAWHGRNWKGPWPRIFSSPYLALLLLWLGSLAAYAWYNLGFIQHQGRYLFPALPAWSLLFAVGWWGVLTRRASMAAGVVVLAAAALHALVGTLGSGVDKWTLLIYGAAGGGLLLHGWMLAPLARRSGGAVDSFKERVGQGEVGKAFSEQFAGGNLQPTLFACLFLMLATLDAAVPFLYIVPHLQRGGQ